MDIIVIVQQNYLQFYLTVAEEICKRLLLITNDFLIRLRVFESFISLFDNNRETLF